jgi:hypothetical protein
VQKGGLIISRHNEIRDKLSDLASKALSPSAVHNKTKIHACHSSPEVKSDKEDKENSVKRLFHNNRNEDCGDILIRGLMDVRITDVDAKSNVSKDSDKLSSAHEREKKKKHLGACLEQCRHFSPFVVSADGLAEETIRHARREVGETLL